METQEEKSAAFLEHYGVKGMKWGQRKATIKGARKALKGTVKDRKEAEKEYVKAKSSGDTGRTEAAKGQLNKAHKIEMETRLVAATATRGEQIALGILGTLAFTPIGGAAAVAGNAYSTRDGRPIGDYPVRMLNKLDKKAAKN